MSYRKSNTDKKNLEWFGKDIDARSLMSIEVKGALRSISDCKLEFKYPLTVISGKNGCGKSTILAISVCAYHNGDKGFKLRTRENTYYTFSDFFIQSKEDIKPDGIEITYGVVYPHWVKSKKMPDGRGFGKQVRKKKKGGRWNNYERRVFRNVVVLGIERIVPHSEKSTHKSYRTRFKGEQEEGTEQNIINDVSFILDKDFTKLDYQKFNKYKLPVVEAENIKYSGFNMGAGENALFELFYIVHKMPKGSLIIIDEIELGLHEEAQGRLIKVLKEVCLKLHHQIICTSHSPQVIRCVPEEARIHIEQKDNKTQIYPGISAAYATGKLRGTNSEELDIFIEDDIGKAILSNILSNNLRLRSNSIPIGSSHAILRQMAAMYKIKRDTSIAILDGDKKSNHEKNIKEFLKALETIKTKPEKEKASKWIDERLNYLPGDKWPELWLLEELKKCDLTNLSKTIQVSKSELLRFINRSIRAGKHNEFYTLAEACNLGREIVLNYSINSLFGTSPSELKKLEKYIKSRLK